MAKKQPTIIPNDYKDDAYYGNMFSQHMNNSGFATDYNPYQMGQQAYQQSQTDANQNGLDFGGNDTVGNGFLGSLIDSAQAGAASSFGGTARFLGEFSPVGKDAFNGFADTMDEIARNNTPLEKPEGANYVAGAIGNAIGSGGAAMAEAAIVAGIGAALGIGSGATAGAMGVGGLVGRAYTMKGSMAAGKALGRVTMQAIERTPALGHLARAAESMWKSGFGTKIMLGEVFGSPFEAMAEAGNLITEMRQEGYSDDEIRSSAIKSAAYNTAWLTVANIIEGKAGMAIQGATNIGSKLGKVAMASVGDAAGEGMEEFGQNLIGNVAKGEELNYDEAKEAALQGAIGGAFLGGGRQAIDSYLNKDNINNEENIPVPQVDAAERLRQGLAEETPQIQQPIEQPVQNVETPVVQPIVEDGEIVMPNLEIGEADNQQVPQETQSIEQQPKQPEQPIEQSITEQQSIVENTQQENIQQPNVTEPTEKKEPVPKKPIIGSATAYKEPEHQWKSVEQAQADLDAIVEDVRQNGKKYSNLRDLKKTLKSKLIDDLIDKQKKQNRRSLNTIDGLVDSWHSKAKTARAEWEANNGKATVKTEKPVKPTTKTVNKKNNDKQQVATNKSVVKNINTNNTTVETPITSEPIKQQNGDNINENIKTPAQTPSEISASTDNQVPNSKLEQSGETKADNQGEGQDGKVGQIAYPKKISKETLRHPKKSDRPELYWKNTGLTPNDIAIYGDWQIMHRNGKFLTTREIDGSIDMDARGSFDTAEEAVAFIEKKMKAVVEPVVETPTTPTVTEPVADTPSEPIKEPTELTSTPTGDNEDKTDKANKDITVEEKKLLDRFANKNSTEIIGEPGNGNRLYCAYAENQDGEKKFILGWYQDKSNFLSDLNGNGYKSVKSYNIQDAKLWNVDSLSDFELYAIDSKMPQKIGDYKLVSDQSFYDKAVNGQPLSLEYKNKDGKSLFVEALGGTINKSGKYKKDNGVFAVKNQDGDILSVSLSVKKLKDAFDRATSTLGENGNEISVPIKPTEEPTTTITGQEDTADKPAERVEPTEEPARKDKQQKIIDKAEAKFGKYALSNAIKNISSEDVRKPLRALYDDLNALVDEFASTPVEKQSLENAKAEFTQTINEFFEDAPYSSMPNAKAKFVAEFDKKLQAKENARQKAKAKEVKKAGGEKGYSKKFSKYLADKNLLVDGTETKLLTSPCGITQIETDDGMLSSEQITPDMTWADAIEVMAEKKRGELIDLVDLSAYKKYGNESNEYRIISDYMDYYIGDDEDEVDFGTPGQSDVGDSETKAKDGVAEINDSSQGAKNQGDGKPTTKIETLESGKSTSSQIIRNDIDSVVGRKGSNQESNPNKSTAASDVQESSTNGRTNVENGTGRSEETENGLASGNDSNISQVDDSEGTTEIARGREDATPERVEQEDGNTTRGVEENKTEHPSIAIEDVIKKAQKAHNDFDDKNFWFDDVETFLKRLSKEDSYIDLNLRVEKELAESFSKNVPSGVKFEKSPFSDSYHFDNNGKSAFISYINERLDEKIKPLQEQQNKIDAENKATEERVQQVEIDRINESNKAYSENKPFIDKILKNVDVDKVANDFEKDTGAAFDNEFENNGFMADAVLAYKVANFSAELRNSKEFKQLEDFLLDYNFTAQSEELEQWLNKNIGNYIDGEAKYRYTNFQYARWDAEHPNHPDAIARRQKQENLEETQTQASTDSIGNIVDSIVNDDGKYNTVSKIEDAVEQMSTEDKKKFFTRLKHALIKDNLGVFNRDTSLDEQIEYLSQTIEDYCEGHEIPTSYENYLTDIDETVLNNLKKNKYKSIDKSSVDFSESQYGYLVGIGESEDAKELMTMEIYYAVDFITLGDTNITADDVRRYVNNLDPLDRPEFFKTLKRQLAEDCSNDLEITDGKASDPENYSLTDQLNDFTTAIGERAKELGLPEEYEDYLTDITRRSKFWGAIKTNDGSVSSVDIDDVEEPQKKHKLQFQYENISLKDVKKDFGEGKPIAARQKIFNKIINVMKKMGINIVVDVNEMIEYLKRTEENVKDVYLKPSGELEIRYTDNSTATVGGFYDSNTGMIYVNPVLLSTNSAVHEYTHLWFAVFKERHPELYKKAVDYLSQTEFAKKLANSKSYGHLANNKEELANEVLAHLGGYNGSKLLNQEHNKSLVNKIKSFIERLYRDVKLFLIEKGIVSERHLEDKDLFSMAFDDLIEENVANITHINNDALVQEGKEFISKALSSAINANKNLWNVSEKQDEIYKSLLGTSLLGYKVQISAGFVRHSFRQANNPQNKNSLPMKKGEMMEIINVINNPDTMEFNGNNTVLTKGITLKKNINGNLFTVNIAAQKRGKRLEFKLIKKESLPDNNLSINTQPVSTSTSKSRGKPTPSKESVSQKSIESNMMFSKSVPNDATTEEKLASTTVTSRPQTLSEKAKAIRSNPTSYIADLWKKFYIDWVDKNDMFKDIDKLHEKVLGRKLKSNEKIYGRAQGITSTANGVGDVLIGGDAEELAGINKRLKNKKLKHPNGTMKHALENLKEDKLDNDSKNFMKRYGFKDAVEALGSALTWRRLREMTRQVENAHKQWEHEKKLMDAWEKKREKYNSLKEQALAALEDGKQVTINGKTYTSKSAIEKAFAVGTSPLAQHHTDWLNAKREWMKAHEKWRKAKKQAERHNQPFTDVDPSIAMKEAWKNKCKQEHWVETTAEPSTQVGEEPTYKLPSDLTAEELDKGIASIPKQFLKACDDYYDMNDNILCLLEDANVIDNDLHELLNTTYKEYCPLQRDSSDTQGLDEYLAGFGAGGSGPANVSNMIKEISKEGSKKTVINPLETTVKTAMMAARRAERNKVALKLIELADVPGMETVVKRVDPVGYEKDGSPKYPAADPRYSTFTVMENGQKVTYQTSPEYYQAIVGYDEPSSNIVWDSLSIFAQFLRTGATMTPSFIVRNGFRDSVLAGYMTNVGFKPIIGTINGIRKLHAKTGKEAELNAIFKSMGFGSMTRERDGQAIYDNLQKQVGSDKIDFTNPISLWNAFKDWFVGLNEDVELGTRRELFGLAMDKYGADFKAGKISYEDLIQMAAEIGRFGTTDFTRSGIKGQQVNRVSAFFNANVQGVDLYVQGLKNPETRARMLGFIGTYIGLPCLAIWAANHDKDWWKELDPQVKYTNFCVSEYFRVPLPQEAGVMFGGGLMAILDMAMDNDPKAMKIWGHAVKESLCPNPIPTVLTPIMEWQANYSFFKGRPIVNQRLQKLPDDMQYDNYTTELSKMIGKVANLSPKKLDNTVKGIGATLGIQGWDVLGDALVMAMGDNKVRPDKDFREKVFVRDFNVTEGIRGRYTNDFYELWSEASKLKSAGRTTRKQEKAIKSINAAQRTISKLNKEIRMIGDPENTRLTSSQKQEMLAIRREKIKRIAKQAIDKYGSYFE